MVARISGSPLPATEVEPCLAATQKHVFDLIKIVESYLILVYPLDDPIGASSQLFGCSEKTSPDKFNLSLYEFARQIHKFTH